MNIEFLQEQILIFTQEVIDSGFKRDVEDYHASLPAMQNNIVNLRHIADQLLSKLDSIYNHSELPDALRALLPENTVRPFTDSPHYDDMKNLVNDNKVQQQEFFNKLHQQVNALKDQIQQNSKKIDSIKAFIAPYITSETKALSDQKHAVISISFKDKRTITNLPIFTKTLNDWTRILPIYHRLLLSASPEDIGIVEVQNSSIDLILNLNVDVALNLTDLFKVGLECYAGYLLYKNLNKPIVNTFYGNKKLLELERAKEKELLKNIRTAVEGKALEQHDKAKKQDETIETTSTEGKIREITKLVTNHIIKGNDIKLLAVPQIDDEKEKQQKTSSDELHKKSAEVRKLLRAFPAEDQQKLLEMYSSDRDDSTGE